MQHSTSTSIFRSSLLFIFFIEILSFFGYLFSDFNTIALVVLTLLVFFISLRHLEIGWLVLVAELIIGSKGHLFSMMVFGIPVSIRLTLFLSVFAATIIDMIRNRSFALKQSSLWKPFLSLLGALIIGGAAGIFYGNDLRTLFLDFNGYLYLGAAVIVAQVMKDRKNTSRLLWVAAAATVASIVKTLLLTFFFSHQLPVILPYVYRWVRVTGVGEITAMNSGFYRIFFQSHLFEIFALLTSLCLLWGLGQGTKRGPKQWGLWILSLFSAMVILLSYSRSFWLGVMVGLLLLGVYLRKIEHARVVPIVRAAAVVIGIFLLSAVLVLGIVKFPYPRPSALVVSDLVSERTEDISSEVGGASRLALLGPLAHQALKNPITGTGFGTKVTYRTSDPRALLANPDGLYSTYAFEWGYLGFIVKFGIIGTLAMLWFVFSIVRQGMQLLKHPLSVGDRGLVAGMLVSIGVLLAVHATTPYLDHPIGLGFLLMAFGIFRGLASSSS